MRECDETVKQKRAEKREAENEASDVNGERHFKGKLSFALAHTQACYKDSFTIFTVVIGVFFLSFFFLISVAYNVNKQKETARCGCHSPINLWNKQDIHKTHRVRLSFVIEKQQSVLYVCVDTFLLCINTAKDI